MGSHRATLRCFLLLPATPSSSFTTLPTPSSNFSYWEWIKLPPHNHALVPPPTSNGYFSVALPTLPAASTARTRMLYKPVERPCGRAGQQQGGKDVGRAADGHLAAGPRVHITAAGCRPAAAHQPPHLVSALCSAVGPAAHSTGRHSGGIGAARAAFDQQAAAAKRAGAVERLGDRGAAGGGRVATLDGQLQVAECGLVWHRLQGGVVQGTGPRLSQLKCSNQPPLSCTCATPLPYDANRDARPAGAAPKQGTTPPPPPCASPPPASGTARCWSRSRRGRWSAPPGGK